MDAIFDKKTGKKLGEFIESTAGFRITSLNLPSNWEYIYQNRDVLMKVDQFGPVYAQMDPPGDIQMFRRESGQKFSNWIVWIKKEGAEPFNNFFRPHSNVIRQNDEPKNLNIEFLPEKAVYSFENEGLSVKTEFAIPLKGREIAMRFTIENNSDEDVKLRVCPFLMPYVNVAQLAPWDKNEWYLRSGYGVEGDKGVFWTNLLNPAGNREKRRTMTLLTEMENLKSVEISREKFMGNGSEYCPQYAIEGTLNIPAKSGKEYGKFYDETQIYSYLPVYAMEYEWEIKAGEKKSLCQTLSMAGVQTSGEMPSKEEVLKTSEWKKLFDEKVSECKDYFEKIFKANTIKTPDELFDYYTNYWVPIQMNWVASLDRGWPSGMRGTRDSAQDYAGLLYTDLKSCREVILTLLSCQRTDGWFPRQYSALGRHGNHDLRPYVDGGAFLLELFYNYLALSDDKQLLSVNIPWLDSDNESSVWEHIKTAMGYYINPENIGEHGLCKIRGGDWLDSVSLAGTEGRGETVTVTCQCVLALYFMADICEKYGIDTELIAKYKDCAESFKNAVQNSAFNKKGYFNSVFNDDGKWIFSDLDPDGEERPYGVCNWYAVISKTAKQEQFDGIFNILDKLKSDMGYRLFYPPFEKPIPHVGRQASGDMPPYMSENGNVYNHGSQGFLARALSKANMGDKLFEVMRWQLPCYQEMHPTEKALTAPYAITNCWQHLPGFDGRGMLSFLTGSVAMCQRSAFEWLIGFEPTLGGVRLSPCMPKSFDEMSLSLSYKGKTLNIKVQRSESKGLTLNGKWVKAHECDERSYREFYFIDDDMLSQGENEILIRV